MRVEFFPFFPTALSLAHALFDPASPPPPKTSLHFLPHTAGSSALAQPAGRPPLPPGVIPPPDYEPSPEELAAAEEVREFFFLFFFLFPSFTFVSLSFLRPRPQQLSPFCPKKKKKKLSTQLDRTNCGICRFYSPANDVCIDVPLKFSCEGNKGHEGKACGPCSYLESEEGDGIGHCIDLDQETCNAPLPKPVAAAPGKAPLPAVAAEGTNARAAAAAGMESADDESEEAAEDESEEAAEDADTYETDDEVVHMPPPPHHPPPHGRN